jgi:AcrR family transcriptional regulator
MSRNSTKDVRERLLEAGVATFRQRGFNGCSVQDITEAAGVPKGSFYNHFESKEDLFEAAVEDVLELLGGLLDQLTASIDDPAEVFAQSFRLFGRFHRKNPELSKVFLSCALPMTGSDRGLAPRARRDIEAGVAAGRFTVRDPELIMTVISGAALCLGQFLHDHPERDDAEATDQVTEDLLRLLGVPARQCQRIIRLPLPDIDAMAAAAG